MVPDLYISCSLSQALDTGNGIVRIGNQQLSICLIDLWFGCIGQLFHGGLEIDQLGNSVIVLAFGQLRGRAYQLRLKTGTRLVRIVSANGSTLELYGCIPPEDLRLTDTHPTLIFNKRKIYEND